MSRVALILTALLVSAPLAHAQRIEDIGAGVISFLLRNPKTADRMKADEKTALEILADLLRTEGQRKHELEYATSTRNQITIQTAAGQQASFVRDTNGTVFLLLDGVIYPIASELVSAAAHLPREAGISVPGAGSTPETALNSFLNAAYDSALARMTVWASPRGPILVLTDTAYRNPRLERQLEVIQAHLAHERYEIANFFSKSPGSRTYGVTLVRPGCAFIVLLGVGQYPRGWLVDTVKMRDPPVCRRQ